jgi:putative tryptophan/tyrosine transport system substrate-binding protein
MQFDQLKRREFITLLAGAAAWPLAARAQQRERMRRVGVLMNLTPDDAEGQARLAAFLQGLQEAGWAVGRNVRIDLRWGGGDAESFRKQAAELVALSPDVVFASGIPAATPLLQATRTVPIVFAQVVDPVGAGLVASLSRPGGNATGFTSPEYGFAGKWVELIKEIAPGVTRVALLRDATSSSGIGYMGAVRLAASSFGIELMPVGITDAGEIERGVTAFARASNGALIVTGNTLTMVHRELIITLAARHRLPAVYALPLFANDGGLISYGPDSINPYRRAAGYVDRILKGEKPADLPVQQPTKFELIINLKTANALGLTMPPTLLARADEVIE